MGDTPTSPKIAKHADREPGRRGAAGADVRQIRILPRGWTGRSELTSLFVLIEIDDVVEKTVIIL